MLKSTSTFCNEFTFFKFIPMTRKKAKEKILWDHRNLWAMGVVMREGRVGKNETSPVQSEWFCRYKIIITKNWKFCDLNYTDLSVHHILIFHICCISFNCSLGLSRNNFQAAFSIAESLQSFLENWKKECFVTTFSHVREFEMTSFHCNAGRETLFQRIVGRAA